VDFKQVWGKYGKISDAMKFGDEDQMEPFYSDLVIDVHFGRGSHNYNKAGNRIFRYIIAIFTNQFPLALPRHQKAEFVEKIYSALIKPGFRFLCHVKSLDSWKETSVYVAKKKIGHTLRDVRNLKVKSNSKMFPDHGDGWFVENSLQNMNIDTSTSMIIKVLRGFHLSNNTQIDDKLQHENSSLDITAFQKDSSIETNDQAENQELKENYFDETFYYYIFKQQDDKSEPNFEFYL
jgi:hypothetical protein